MRSKKSKLVSILLILLLLSIPIILIFIQFNSMIHPSFEADSRIPSGYEAVRKYYDLIERQNPLNYYKYDQQFTLNDKTYYFENEYLYENINGEKANLYIKRTNLAEIIGACGDIYTMIYFIHNIDNLYYITQNKLYLVENNRPIFDLGQYSGGYFYYDGCIYYNYGDECELTALTLGGPVGRTYKKYSFARYNFAIGDIEVISREEYEAKYYETEGR